MWSRKARARPLLDPVLLVRAHGLAAGMNLSRAVRYLEGDDDEMPMTFGVLRPALLLPSSAREWSGARQNAVLRHELIEGNPVLRRMWPPVRSDRTEGGTDGDG